LFIKINTNRNFKIKEKFLFILTKIKKERKKNHQSIKEKKNKIYLKFESRFFFLDLQYISKKKNIIIKKKKWRKKISE
jgi:hypothetical protein